MTAMAVRAWNLIGGSDLAAVPHVCHLLGFDDELLMAELIVEIRKDMESRRER